MEKSFKISEVLDADATDIIGRIRCNKSLGQPIKFKYEIIRCPVCGTESGKLGKSQRAFCPECLREFRIGSEQLEKLRAIEGTEYANCKSCGRTKKKEYFTKDGVCGYCRTMQRSFSDGVCKVCGKERLVHKELGVCYYCHINKKGQKTK